jgi:anaerobic selenocysteine-containing dehydrogenase
MLCPGGCGVLARVVDGRLVKLDGNPLHPVNRGKLCALGQAAPQLLYHPDRLKTPMKRKGGRKSGQWTKISWDEALSEVATRLQELRKAEEPHLFAILNGQEGGLAQTLLKTFCESYGTPNLIDTVQPNVTRLALDLMQGIRDRVSFDLRNAEYLLAFGSDFLDGEMSPVYMARSYAELRQRRDGKRAKIVYVGQRFSNTGARADTWVPVRVGTEAALALAVAYVLIREELYDREFVENSTHGFEDWVDAGGVKHLGFKSLVMDQYRPDDVSAITGTPLDTIIALAKEFGQTRPALAIPGKTCLQSHNPAYTAMAIHSLNALVGGIEAQGGVLVDDVIPFKPVPEVLADGVASKGRGMTRIDVPPPGLFPLADQRPELVPVNILGGIPYVPKVMVLYHSNPLKSPTLGPLYRSALERVPFVVSICTFPNESAEAADLILPDHLFLEKWSDVIAAPIDGVPVVGIAQPVVEPVHNSMAAEDFLLVLAQRMGGSVSQALPWSDFKSFVSYSVKGIHDAAAGSLFASADQESYVRELARRGWAAAPPSSFDQFWDQLLEKGGWWGLLHEARIGAALNSPSGKFEFRSQRLESCLRDSAAAAHRTLEDQLKELAVEAAEETAFLPHFESIRGRVDDKEYPFLLYSFGVPGLDSELASHAPSVRELTPQGCSLVDGRLEINPETALKQGIADGDWVLLESPKGRIKIRARVYPGAMPEVVNLPANLIGPLASGPRPNDRNDGSKIGVECEDRLSGLSRGSSLRVKLSTGTAAKA